MDCVYKLCKGADSQQHIIRDYAHKDMSVYREKHVALPNRRARDITAKRYIARLPPTSRYA